MKNRILKAVTVIMTIVFVLSALALDSPDPTVPLVGTVVSVVWWFGFLVANEFDVSALWR